MHGKNIHEFKYIVLFLPPTLNTQNILDKQIWCSTKIHYCKSCAVWIKKDREEYFLLATQKKRLLCLKEEYCPLWSSINLFYLYFINGILKVFCFVTISYFAVMVKQQLTTFWFKFTFVSCHFRTHLLLLSSRLIDQLFMGIKHVWGVMIYNTISEKIRSTWGKMSWDSY